jgi:head-tail adaptor
MKAPHLTRRLALEAPERVPDGAGGFVVGWSLQGHHWAEVVAGNAGEAAGFVGALSQSVYRISLRAAPVGSSARPVADQRFRDGTRIFRILAVSDHDPGGRYLLCLAREEVAV